MNCDAAFTIGKTHQVCEDYAITYKQDYRLAAVLCDGCSSSEMTDVGARILALTSIQEINISPGSYRSDTSLFLRNLLETLNAQSGKVYHYFPETMYDATLLMSNYDPIRQEIKVVIMGDGFVVAKHREKGLLTHKYYYPSEYPRYLSYEMNPQRKAEFRTVDEGVSVDAYWHDQIHWSTCWEKHTSAYFAHRFKKEEFEWVGIFSDGLDTFKSKNEDGSTTAIECEDVIKELTDFKTFTGNFAKRRLNRFVKDCNKKNWIYDDDISMAVIYMGE